MSQVAERGTPEEACLGLGGSHTPRADGTSMSKLAGQNPREGQTRAPAGDRVCERKGGEV